MTWKRFEMTSCRYITNIQTPFGKSQRSILGGECKVEIRLHSFQSPFSVGYLQRRLGVACSDLIPGVNVEK
jgi:hypothetical protein